MKKKGESDIIFADNPATGRAELCFTPKLQEMLDLMDEAIVKSPNSEDDTCVFASDAIPKGTFEYQSGEMKLKLELPQALTIRRPRGYIAPHLAGKLAPMPLLQITTSTIIVLVILK